MKYSEWKPQLANILKHDNIDLDSLLWKYNIASMYAQGLSPEEVATHIYHKETEKS